MRTITTRDISRDWLDISVEAERAPVCVSSDSAPDLIVMSRDQFEYFRRLAVERLKSTMDRMGAEAVRRGLTEEKLEELLADES